MSQFRQFLGKPEYNPGVYESTKIKIDFWLLKFQPKGVPSSQNHRFSYKSAF